MSLYLSTPTLTISFPTIIMAEQISDCDDATAGIFSFKHYS